MMGNLNDEEILNFHDLAWALTHGTMCFGKEKLSGKELESVLKVLDSNIKRKSRSIGISNTIHIGYDHVSIKTILFDQLDTSFEDLHSLKQAYLIFYLSGIPPVS